MDLFTGILSLAPASTPMAKFDMGVGVGVHMEAGTV